MTTANRYFDFFCKCAVARSLLRPLCLSIFPVMLMAAERNTLEAEQLVDPQEATETAPVAIPPDTHATQQAPQELLIMAVHQPENFIGKTLVLDDGVNAVTVGRVIDLRRRVQDQNIYLIIDATAYFNSAVQYAVAVNDVDRMEADKLVIPEAPGMHLKGLDYYPDDYTDVAAKPAPPPIAEDD